MTQRLNVQTILKKYGLRPKSSWSQNFLVDIEVLNEIARAAETSERKVVELGAGFGALTVRLARDARCLVAVERDRDLAGLLRQEFSDDSVVEILEADAARLNWKELYRRLGEKPVVVGNLPYHIATPILFNLLGARSVLSHWVLMFQKEMAQRLVSEPGSRVYGVLSILVQRLVDVEIVLEVAAGSFFPAPKVRSQVVKFSPLAQPKVAVTSEAMFERVVKGTFNQRRKMIKNSLNSVFSRTSPAKIVDQALEMAGVEPTMRPEQLSIQTFAKLADIFHDLEKEKDS
jgi:16S rRNA (adenine1518-N6/adenine1519-N6)-dimethyltransferase